MALGWKWLAFLLVAPLGLGLATRAWLGAANESAPLGLLRPLPELARSERALPLTRVRRIVVVVIDGLRLDTSYDLPLLNELRSAGFDGQAHAEIPTHSRASYGVILSGTDPERHGVRNNRARAPFAADTLLRRVRLRGGRTTVVSDLDWWRAQFGAEIDDWRSAQAQDLTSLETTFARALESAKSARGATGPDLVVLHSVRVDSAAHRGGIGEAYLREARALDALLLRVLGALDPTLDLLVVTADHGHRTRGGHGGGERDVTAVPLVIHGPGVARSGGPRALGSLAGLAPTLALLSGIDFPRDASFRVYEAALDPSALGRDYVTARLGEYWDQRIAYESDWLGRQGLDARTLVADEHAEQRPEILGRLLALRHAVLARLDARRLIGSRVAGAAVLVLLVVICARLTRSSTTLLGLPVFGTVVFAGLALFSGTFSMSAVALGSRYALLLLVLSSVALLAHVAVAIRLSRAKPGPGGERAHELESLFVRDALVYALLGPLVWLAFGFRHPVLLPGPLLLYLPLPLALGGGFFCGVLGVGLLVARLAARRRDTVVRSSKMG